MRPLSSAATVQAVLLYVLRAGWVTTARAVLRSPAALAHAAALELPRMLEASRVLFTQEAEDALREGISSLTARAGNEGGVGGVDCRMHPLTLRFQDSALEALWRNRRFLDNAELQRARNLFEPWGPVSFGLCAKTIFTNLHMPSAAIFALCAAHLTLASLPNVAFRLMPFAVYRRYHFSLVIFQRHGIWALQTLVYAVLVHIGLNPTPLNSNPNLQKLTPLAVLQCHVMLPIPFVHAVPTVFTPLLARLFADMAGVAERPTNEAIARELLISCTSVIAVIYLWERHHRLGFLTKFRAKVA